MYMFWCKYLPSCPRGVVCDNVIPPSHRRGRYSFISHLLVRGIKIFDAGDKKRIILQGSNGFPPHPHKKNTHPQGMVINSANWTTEGRHICMYMSMHTYRYLFVFLFIFTYINDYIYLYIHRGYIMMIYI